MNNGLIMEGKTAGDSNKKSTLKRYLYSIACGVVVITIFLLRSYVNGIESDLKTRDEAIENLAIESNIEAIRQVEQAVLSIEESRIQKKDGCNALGDNVPYRLIDICGVPLSPKNNNE